MHRTLLRFALLAALLGLPSNSLLARDARPTAADPTTDTAVDEASRPVTEWLQLGPLPMPRPAGAAAAEGAWIEDAWIDARGLRPAANDSLSIATGSRAADTMRWKRTSSRDGAVVLDPRGAPTESAATTIFRSALVTYVETDRWATPTLHVASHQPVHLFLDGELVATKTTIEARDAEAGTLEQELPLAPGTHDLLLLAVCGVEAEEATTPVASKTASQTLRPWTLRAELRGETLEDLDLSLDPRRGLDIRDLLDMPSANTQAISADGRYLAVARSQAERGPESVATRTWTEVWDLTENDIALSLHGGERDLRFAPSGDRLSYAVPGTGEGRHDLWTMPVRGGAARRIARGIEGFESHRWLPHGDALLVTVREAAESDTREVKRFRGLDDRWTQQRDRLHHFVVSADGGLMRRVTVAEPTETLQDVRPDGRALLYTTTDFDLTERPFTSSRLLEVDLDTAAVRELATLGWFDSVRYAPDGRRLLVLGSAALFEGAGRRVPLANDYDTQAFLFDPADGSVDPITADYDPTILGAQWSPHDGAIYLIAQEKSNSKLVRYDPKRRTFLELASGSDVVGGVQVAEAADRLAFVGSSVREPPSVFVRSTKGDDAPRKLIDGSNALPHLELGRVETWTFEHSSASGSEEILGRVTYPPDFDPSKRYPLIVDYYGGTAPKSRSFGGRYPKHYWAANGYVVYTVQPSGATGFGQEFAARHINAWGLRTADEILAGLDAFLAAHPFVDENRVGAIGASYGGFMTMHLLTRTDRFAAAISHAGISNIASYWGEGNWGYLYSSVASANSFPWNAPQVYIEQSPLFRADRISTPLLLLHGAADTNVPVGESHQMYTALKVLGKEVELIEVAGQDHWILDYEKRLLWSQTIVAWFDRYLKDDASGTWDALWGDAESPRG